MFFPSPFSSHITKGEQRKLFFRPLCHPLVPACQSAALNSATQRTMPREYIGNKWGTDCLHTKSPGALTPTLQCAGYNVKLKAVNQKTSHLYRIPLCRDGLNNVKKPVDIIKYLTFIHTLDKNQQFNLQGPKFGSPDGNFIIFTQ